jgi:hypothetical protein
MDPTLRATQPAGYCRAIADELERIATDLRSVEHIELPEPRLFCLDIQPGGSTDAEITEAIDALGTALLGKKGKDGTVSGDRPWYSVAGYRGSIKVNAYRELAKTDERDAELARLRAEIEQLLAERPDAER